MHIKNPYWGFKRSAHKDRTSVCQFGIDGAASSDKRQLLFKQFYHLQQPRWWIFSPNKFNFSSLINTRKGWMQEIWQHLVAKTRMTRTVPNIYINSHSLYTTVSHKSNNSWLKPGHTGLQQQFITELHSQVIKYWWAVANVLCMSTGGSSCRNKVSQD